MKTVTLKAAVKPRPAKKVSPKAKRIQQSGSAPYIVYGDEIRVMLVTPSAGGGWILPKGNIAKSMDTLKSAAKEAFEEAGSAFSSCSCALLTASFRLVRVPLLSLMRYRYY